MLTDAHAHLNDSAYANDLDEVYRNAIENGVRIIVNSAWDRQSSEKAMELADRYPEMYFTVGIHPHNVDSIQDRDFYRLCDLTKHEKCVAWGEIGLDYHFDVSKIDLQKAIFKEQIAIADELSLPVVLHVRDAYLDADNIIKDNIDKMKNGVLLHCYSGSKELAKDFYNKFGFYYSFGGAITFKNNNKKAVLEVIPEDKLLIETDCPYMTPVPFRGNRNSPTYTRYVVDKMALDLGKTPEKIEKITHDNLVRFYRIKE